ncbi:LysR family transcriptional regulator [Glaciecola siphonariae]|uniref:HTH-type transcriptional regulator MetR n=1 Tax=Glaciecola siphonariae TaxID=521012 RepID=A0ABV9LYB6_9ALTE
MLERYHLQILRTVAKRGTITAAAQELNLTQSALSHAVKKLEQRFNVQIWQKDGRNVRLSPAGTEILQLSKRLLPQFEYTETRLAQIAKGERGNLRIGMECHPCYHWLLKVVKPFMHTFNDVDIDVKQQFQFGALGALLEYDIDMVITPDPLHHESIKYIKVFDYEHVLVVSTEHALTNKQHILPNDLSHETLITYPVERERLDIFSRFLTPAGGNVKQHKQIEATEIMLQMVAAKRGVAALPLWLVEDFQAQLDICAIPFGPHRMQKSIFLGVRKKEIMPDYVSGFIEFAAHAQTHS